MKKLLAILLTLALTFSMVAALAAPEKVVIYYICKLATHEYFIGEYEAAKAKLTELGVANGVEVEFVVCDADMDSEACLNYVDTAVSAKANGIMICVTDQTMSQAVVDKCTEAGIPVVAVDDALEVGGEKLAPWFGIDAYNIGVGIGEWTAEYVKANNLIGDPEAALLYMTMSTTTSCVPRTEGEKKVFESVGWTGPVYEGDCDGTQEDAYNAATAVVTGHPEITKWIVMTANEACATGAAVAVEQAGVADGACIVSCGADEVPFHWEKGEYSSIKSCAYFSGASIGRAAVENLFNYIMTGAEIEMTFAVPADMITMENYTEFWP